MSRLGAAVVVTARSSGTGVRLGVVGPRIIGLNDLWAVSEESEIEHQVADRTGIRSQGVADAVGYMLTRPRHVTIRDLVVLRSNQDI